MLVAFTNGSQDWYLIYWWYHHYFWIYLKIEKTIKICSYCRPQWQPIQWLDCLVAVKYATLILILSLKYVVISKMLHLQENASPDSVVIFYLTCIIYSVYLANRYFTLLYSKLQWRYMKYSSKWSKCKIKVLVTNNMNHSGMKYKHVFSLFWWEIIEQ